MNLGLTLQDPLLEVRHLFGIKASRLLGKLAAAAAAGSAVHLALAAKYAAFLPLAAVDPNEGNKGAAARWLAEWVEARRAAAARAAQRAAAAPAGAKGGNVAQVRAGAASFVACCWYKRAGLLSIARLLQFRWIPT